MKDANGNGRKKTILKMAAAGQTDQQIAHQLGISVETVRSHWKEMRRRYNASSRTQIVAEFLGQTQPTESEEIVELLALETAERQRAESSLEEANKRLAEALADLTYKRQTELLKLRAEVERLRELERAVEDSPITFSRGQYGGAWAKTYVTRNFQRATGHDPEDLLAGRISPADLFELEDLGRLVAHVEAGVAEGKRNFLALLKGKTKDGDPFWAYEFVMVQVNEKGEPTHFSTAFLRKDVADAHDLASSEAPSLNP